MPEPITIIVHSGETLQLYKVHKNKDQILLKYNKKDIIIHFDIDKLRE